MNRLYRSLASAKRPTDELLDQELALKEAKEFHTVRDFFYEIVTIFKSIKYFINVRRLNENFLLMKTN